MTRLKDLIQIQAKKMMQIKNNKWALSYLRKVEVINYILIYLFFSCSYERADTGRRSLIVNQKDSIQIKESVEPVNLYKDVYNAETGHWFSYPKTFKVISNTYGDTLHLISEDSLVSVKKWVDLKSMPISYFDKNGDGDVDSLIDMNEVYRMYKFSVENYVSKFGNKNVDVIKSEDYVSLTSVKDEESVKKIKVLLCDVVGGTKVPVFLEVTYDDVYANKREIDYILDSFKGKFIQSKK